MRHVVGFLAMSVGVSLVLSLVVGLNARQQPPKAKPRVSRDINVAPPPPKPKRKPKPKPRRKPRKQVRRTVAPPPALATGISSMSLGTGALGGSSLMDAGNSLLGGDANPRDLVMTEDAVDSPPRPTSRQAPAYPPRARAKGVTGVVSLSILIDTQGNVQRVKVLESRPPGVFDQAAVAAVRRWRFDAASYRGQKVKVWARQNVRFSLQ